jgi:hypothetical protein
MQAFRLKGSRIICLVTAAVLGMSLSQASFATKYSFTGTIASINPVELSSTCGSLSNVCVNRNATNYIYMGGSGVNGAFGNNCGTGIPGYPAQWLMFTDDSRGQQLYATALAARLAGATVTVTVDDAVKITNDPGGVGYCVVLTIAF